MLSSTHIEYILKSRRAGIVFCLLRNSSSYSQDILTLMLSEYDNSGKFKEFSTMRYIDRKNSEKFTLFEFISYNIANIPFLFLWCKLFISEVYFLHDFFLDFALIS